MSIISENLKTIRILNKITQIELAKLSGVSNTYINRIEKGVYENPSLDVLNKLATALNCTVEELTGKKIEIEPVEKSIERSINKILDMASSNVDQVSVAALILERLSKEKIIDENFTFTSKLKELLEDAIKLDAKLNNSLRRGLRD